MENENIVKQFLNRDDVMAVIASTNSLEGFMNSLLRVMISNHIH